MKESTTTRKVIDRINALPDGRAIKMHASAAQGAGEPDVFACVGGRMVVVEVKRRGERPRPLQDHVLRAWRKAGAVAIWTTDADEVIALLRERGITSG